MASRIGLLVAPRLLRDGLARVLTSRGHEIVDVSLGDPRVTVMIVSDPPSGSQQAAMVIAVPADGGPAAIIAPDGTVLRHVTGLEGILEAVEEDADAGPR